MQVVNTKTQTTNTKQNNSTLFQDDDDIGKVSLKKDSQFSFFLFYRYLTIIDVDWFKF